MRHLLLITAFVFITSAQAQNHELGKVSKAELEQKRHPDDTSAVAAILFKKGHTTFKYTANDGFESFTEVSVRIKIYKTEGLDWANFEVPYYVGYQKLDDEAIAFSKGMTYNLEGGKIVKTKVANENLFKKRIDEFWNSRSVTFPNVKPGSVLELRYIMKSQNLAMLPDFRFQYSIPVDFAEYKIEVPEFYIYQGIRTGYVRINTDSKIEMASQSFTNKYQQTNRLSYNQVVSTFTASEVPALIEEEYVDNIDNYYAKIDHELQVVRWPDTKPEQIATSWEDVAKSIYGDDDFGKELEKYQYFASDLPNVVVNKSTNSEKMEAIFDFVKNRMTWNERYGYDTRDGVEKAYANRTGNVAEINLMLVAMLRMAGLEANPVLLSTRKNGKAPFPTRTRLNYVIASVMVDNKMQLLDATYKLAAPNVLPLRDLNGTGRMIQKGGIITEVPLVPILPSTEIVLLLGTINYDGTVNGQVQQQYTNHDAYLFRERFVGMDRQQFVEKQEQKHQIEIAEFQVENETVLSKPLTVKYNFTTDNAVEIIGDKMYLSPLLFFANEENPFKQDYRSYPVDFIYPTQEKINITLTIPEGYVIETMPTGMNLAMDDKMGNFKYNIDSSGKKIQLSATFDIIKPLFQSDKYEMLKNFFRNVISKQNEKIILKKV